MDRFFQEIKQLLAQGRGFFPSALPIGMAQFDDFCLSIFDTYLLPDNDSYRHAIASMIMHLGPTAAYKPKRFFAMSVKKAMANQIAYQMIQELKKKEQEYIEATMTKPTSEATLRESAGESKQASV